MMPKIYQKSVKSPIIYITEVSLNSTVGLASQLEKAWKREHGKETVRSYYCG